MQQNGYSQNGNRRGAAISPPQIQGGIMRPNRHHDDWQSGIDAVVVGALGIGLLLVIIICIMVF